MQISEDEAILVIPLVVLGFWKALEIIIWFFHHIEVSWK